MCFFPCLCLPLSQLLSRTQAEASHHLAQLWFAKAVAMWFIWSYDRMLTLGSITYFISANWCSFEQHNEFCGWYVKEDIDHMPDIWGEKAKYVRQCIMSCSQGRSEKSAFQNTICSLENDSHSVINGLYSTLGWCLYFTVKTFPLELLQHLFESFCLLVW